MRFSYNKLKNSFEVGNSSSWVMTFESVGTKSPNVNNLNLINKEFTPAIDVQFDELEVKNLTIEVGPGIPIDIPVFAIDHPHSISVTLYDSHQKQIREEILDWVTKKLSLVKGRAPILTDLKNYCALLKVHNFDKQLNPVNQKAFYVIPGGSLPYRGDQSFVADTLPITFTVLGTQ